MEPIDSKFYFRKRYLVGLFVFFGIMVNSLMRVDINIVLVEIIHPKSVFKGNETVILQPAVINWNSKQVGFIMGTSAYGLVPALFASGILARKYGGATLFSIGLFTMSTLTLLTPITLLTNFWLLTILRIVVGIGQGFLHGASIEIYLHWAPIEERARLAMTEFSGGVLGIILSYNISSYIMYFLDWKAVFYVTGAAGLCFSLLFFTLISNQPANDRLITKVERQYLVTVIDQQMDENSIFSYPWGKIFKSKPFWAYTNDFFCCGWVGSFVLYSLPLYIKDVTNTNTRNVALLSSIPILCSFISEIVFSYVFDYVRNCKLMGLSKMYKMFISFCHFGVALCLTIMVLWSTFEINLVFLSVIRILLGIKFICYGVMPIDVFFQYAAIVKNFAQGCHHLTNILSPMLMGFIVTNHESSEWNLYFALLIIFNIISIFVFCRYGSGELQSWAASPTKTKHDNPSKSED